MSGRRASAWFRVATPAAPGAIAVVEIGGDAAGALEAIGVRGIDAGCVGLRDIAGVDECVVARFGERFAVVTPHAGAGVVREICGVLASAGIERVDLPDAVAAHPEAADLTEALMLEALPNAESPAAVDVLLAQPGRWRAWDDRRHPIESVRRVSRVLDRLIRPALVVAAGRPNVGKSTLTNALARSAVSIVADEPGTTRDHVGVSLELPTRFGGVVVRWVDAPGVRESADLGGEIEAEAVRLARAVISAADLVVICGDSASGFAPAAELGVPAGAPILYVATRCDLGVAEGAEIETAAKTGVGVEELADAVRRVVVPDEALEWDGPWIFDDRLPGVRGAAAVV